MKVVTVLRSGGEFEPKHVEAMRRQVMRWGPIDVEFLCLSDVPIPGVETLPLLYKWPGWWAKMELFRPDLTGDFLYTDLDNVILGPIEEFEGGLSPGLQKGGWTALMWLPEQCRASIWEEFMHEPSGWMRVYAQENRPVENGVGNYGDAGFISMMLLGNYWTWEEKLPGETMNIVEMRVPTPFGPKWLAKWPDDVHVMLCGQPHRPWKLPMFWKLRLYGENI